MNRIEYELTLLAFYVGDNHEHVGTCCPPSALGSFTHEQVFDIVVKQANEHNATVQVGVPTIHAPSGDYEFCITSRKSPPSMGKPPFNAELFVDQLGLHMCCVYTRHTRGPKTDYYRCRLGDKCRHSRTAVAARDGNADTDSRPNTSSSQVSCASRLSITRNPNKSVTIKARLLHTGHFPGSSPDLSELPLREPIRKHLLHAAQFCRDHHMLSAQMDDWKANTYFPRIGYVPFDDLDGRFCVESRDISNALEAVKLASRLSPSDMRSTFAYLLAQPSSTDWVFRGSMCGDLAFRSSLIRNKLRACLVSMGTQGRPTVSQHPELVDSTDAYIFNVLGPPLGEPLLLVVK